jgi:hypothetical protein
MYCLVSEAVFLHARFRFMTDVTLMQSNQVINYFVDVNSAQVLVVTYLTVRFVSHKMYDVIRPQRVSNI